MARSFMMLPGTDCRKKPGTAFAAVDIGSYTARLLIAEKSDSPPGFRALLRRRAYIKLAEGFKEGEGGKISEEAILRLLSVLGDFKTACQEWNAIEIRSVATGVMRRAENKDQVVQRIMHGWGRQVQVINGEDEAKLTGLGVIQALPLDHAAFVIFDLGGGSTEFLYRKGTAMEALSIPLGTVIFSQQYTPSAPPVAGAIAHLEKNVDAMLHRTLPPRDKSFVEPWILAGTGGTVTTLAAMIHGIDTLDIHPTLINGLKIDYDKLLGLIDRMKDMTLEERAEEKGLDKDRAPVILAGAVMVERILHYFQCPQLVSSLSDILDGIMIDQLNTLV